MAQITQSEITVSTFKKTEKTIDIELPKKLVDNAHALGVNIPEAIEKHFRDVSGTSL